MTALLPAATELMRWTGGGPGFGWWLLIPLLWFALFVVLIVVLGRRWRRGGPPWAEARIALASRSAESTLAERFAQGDIDEVEYRARLEVLRANRETPPAEPRR